MSLWKSPQRLPLLDPQGSSCQVLLVPEASSVYACPLCLDPLKEVPAKFSFILKQAQSQLGFHIASCYRPNLARERHNI